MVDVDGLDMRDRILSEGLRLFVARGYDGISMREIADACHLSKAGLYYHFKDKQDLFLEILEQSLNELDVLTHQAAIQPGGARQQIIYFVQAIFTDLSGERREMIRLANQDIGKVSSERRAAFNNQYQQRFLGPLAGIMRDGIARGELRAMNPDLAVWGLLGVMYPFFNDAHHHLGGNMEMIVDFVLTVYLEGVMRRE